MAAHRYWGLLIAPRAGSGVGLAELIMRSSVGGANLATGGTPGSTTSSGGQVASHAFDGSDSAQWFLGTALPATLLWYELPTPASVIEMEVRNAGPAAPYPGSSYGPGAVWVQWSDDGVTWRYGTPGADLSGLGDAGVATISSVSDTAPQARVVGAAIHPVSTAILGNPRGTVAGVVVRHDADTSGTYRVAGTVAIDGTPTTPVVRRVRLFHTLSGRLVRETWSAPDGTFAFEQLALGRYTVLSHDHAGIYNAVVADAITPVP